MPWWAIVLIVLGVILVGGLVFVIVYGKKMQRRQAESEKQMEATKQQVTLLVIDKAKKKMKEAGLPESVIAQTPKYARNMKIPVVKAKIGPKIVTLIADGKVYDIIPVKKTCTVTVSGLYITELKGVRGQAVPKIPEKKKKWIDKLRDKAYEAQMK